MNLPWNELIGGVAKIADDLITTDEERAKMALEDRKIEAALQQGQVETNKIEAAHASLFVAGWRPYAGWVASTALGMVYIPKAIVMTIVWTIQCQVVMTAWNGITPAPVMPAFPDLGVTDLIGLLLALLGMAGFRSFDKRSDTETKRIG